VERDLFILLAGEQENNKATEASKQKLVSFIFIILIMV
jgi:hypothetical protein